MTITGSLLAWSVTASYGIGEYPVTITIAFDYTDELRSYGIGEYPVTITITN